jgi:hypothetical protein
MVWSIMDRKLEDDDEHGHLAIWPRLVEIAFVGPSGQPRFWKVSMLHAVLWCAECSSIAERHPR